jgi:hypothetical protein
VASCEPARHRRCRTLRGVSRHPRDVEDRGDVLRAGRFDPETSSEVLDPLCRGGHRRMITLRQPSDHAAARRGRLIRLYVVIAT